MQDNDLKMIINNFGVNNQLRKLQEETYELTEAVLQMENVKKMTDGTSTFEEHKDHIAEEIADCLVILSQFQKYYGITPQYLHREYDSKIKRTIRRIKNGYYNK